MNTATTDTGHEKARKDLAVDFEKVSNTAHLVQVLCADPAMDMQNLVRVSSLVGRLHALGIRLSLLERLSHK